MKIYTGSVISAETIKFRLLNHNVTKNNTPPNMIDTIITSTYIPLYPNISYTSQSKTLMTHCCNTICKLSCIETQSTVGNPFVNISRPLSAIK